MNKTSQKPYVIRYIRSKLHFTASASTWYDKLMYRIFIIEDDDVIAGAIADNLNNWGFAVLYTIVYRLTARLYYSIVKK